MTILKVPLDKIFANPWQTRQGTPDPEYIKDLALNIAANGLLQNPAGRLILNDKPLDPSAYGGPAAALADEPESKVQLAFGHNRLAAFRWLFDLRNNSDVPGDFSRIPVEVGLLTDEQMADFAWSENEKRRDHTPLERALAIQKRIEHFGWTQQEIAEHLGISRSVIANSLRLLKLPEDILSHLQSGELIERQAHAILSLFDLPESLRIQAQTHWNIETRPENILADAMLGISSDVIRQRIEKMINSFCKSLGDVPWKLDDRFGELIACRVCPQRIPARNACMDPACHNAKYSLYRADYLSRASDASGYLPLEGDKSAYDVTKFSYHASKEDLESILKAGCPNLRVVYNKTDSRYSRHDPDTLNDLGFPDAQVVCSKRNGFCTCLKGLAFLRSQPADTPAEIAEDDDDDGAKVMVDADCDGLRQSANPSASEVQAETADEEKTSSTPVVPTALDLEEAARKARAEKRRTNQLTETVRLLAGARLAQGLEDHDPAAWRLFADELLGWKLSFEKTEKLSYLELCYAFGDEAAVHFLPLDPKSLAEMLDRVNRRLSSAGLRPLTADEVEGNHAQETA
jgi:ParB/RepB/Spo0J family partition protein